MKNQITIESLEQLPQVVDWMKDMIARSGSTIVALDASMGAGKTTLVGAYCHAMGVEGNVSSPTFALVNPYKTRDGAVIYHFDFYRVETVAEALDMGVFDYFDSGNLCFVEWPERVSTILEQCDVLSIKIEVLDDGSRRFSVVEI